MGVASPASKSTEAVTASRVRMSTAGDADFFFFLIGGKNELKWAGAVRGTGTDPAVK
jgi:hypothetical protein